MLDVAFRKEMTLMAPSTPSQEGMGFHPYLHHDEKDGRRHQPTTMVLLASLRTVTANIATTATLANTRAKPLSGRPYTAESGAPSAAVARPPGPGSQGRRRRRPHPRQQRSAAGAPLPRASCSKRRRGRHRSAVPCRAGP